MNSEMASNEVMNIVKTSSLILFLTLIGCGRPAGKTEKVMLVHTNDLVLKWVPMGSSLGVARQNMEQHDFKCSVISYNSAAEMKEPGATNIWKGGVSRNGISTPVTNVTRLECKKGPIEVLFTVVNGETKGLASNFTP